MNGNFTFLHSKFRFHILSFLKIIFQWRPSWEAVLPIFEESNTITLPKKCFYINMGVFWQNEGLNTNPPDPPPLLNILHLQWFLRHPLLMRLWLGKRFLNQTLSPVRKKINPPATCQQQLPGLQTLNIHFHTFSLMFIIYTWWTNKH